MLINEIKYIRISIISILSVLILIFLLNKYNIVKLHNLINPIKINENFGNTIDETKINNIDNKLNEILDIHNKTKYKEYNVNNISVLEENIKNILQGVDMIKANRKRLEKAEYERLKNKLDNILEETIVNDTHQIIHNNTDTEFNLTHNLMNDNNKNINTNIQIDSNGDGYNNKCLDHNMNEKECNKNDNTQKFKIKYIDNYLKYNEYLHPKYENAKINNLNNPFNIVQIDCNNCNKNDRKYKQCLTILRDNNNKYLNVFTKDCNGGSSQYFHKL